MVRYRLDSVNAFGRKGYWLQITCRNCGYTAERDPTPLLIDLIARKLSFSIEKVEARARCTKCGHRGATIGACEPPA
ncbi:hypothetical protein DL238_14840 [Alteriqipengyuania lutimaris]|uniref:Uncharacterized protein n=1 Tax=Alteriqipengyuania lutimaris TaxID=1538146 RepID=A0A395LGE3_9SPHN|nr:hypothetical protein DL238_14840 [Alteriqipengyuania lutimaris]